MSTRDARLKTIQEIIEAFDAPKEMAIWRARDNSCVSVYQRRNWESMLIWDMSQYYFTIRKEVPEYRAFKTVEEVEPFYGQCVNGYTNGRYCSGLVLGAYDSDGYIHVEIGARGMFLSKYLLDNFKFVKTGKPVGIEVK